MNITGGDMSVQRQYHPESSVRNESPAQFAEVTAPVDIKPAEKPGDGGKIPSVYEQNKARMAIQQDMDALLKLIMPDLGMSFRIHEGGSIITTVTNNTTQEVVREFPAEKILDIVHSMVQRLGLVANRKV